MDGANNLEETMASFDYYIVEMQTNFNQHLKPEKIEEYFRLILGLHGAEMVRELFDYILVVKGKYLQMMTVYYIFKRDVARVQCNFERFNEHYFQLKERLDNVIADESLYKVDKENKNVTTDDQQSLQVAGQTNIRIRLQLNEYISLESFHGPKPTLMVNMEVEESTKSSVKDSEKCFDLKKARNKKIVSLAVTLTIGLIITVVLVIFMPKAGQNHKDYYVVKLMVFV